MLDTQVFINQILSPAVLISGIGLILLGMNNRFIANTGRIRELNSEIRRISEIHVFDETHKKRLLAIKSQITTMLGRCNTQKQAIFMLYLAMVFVIFTVLSIAANLANVTIFQDIPKVTSVVALFFILISVMLEGWETTMAMRTVREDFRASCEMLPKEEIDLFQ